MDASIVGRTAVTQCGMEEAKALRAWEILIMSIFISYSCQPYGLIGHNGKTGFSHLFLSAPKYSLHVIRKKIRVLLRCKRMMQLNQGQWKKSSPFRIVSKVLGRGGARFENEKARRWW